MNGFVVWHNERTVNRIDSEDECSYNLKEEYRKLQLHINEVE